MYFLDSRAEVHQKFCWFFEKFKKSRSHSQINWPSIKGPCVSANIQTLRQPLPSAVGPAWPSQAGFCAPFCPFMTLSFPEFSSIFLLLLFPQGNCFYFYFDGKTGFKGPLTWCNVWRCPQLLTKLFRRELSFSSLVLGGSLNTLGQYVVDFDCL